MVSTDSEKIAEISRVNVSSVPFMAVEPFHDYSTTPDVLFEVLKETKKMELNLILHVVYIPQQF